MARQIRTYGDPVLKSKAAPITAIDGKVARLVDTMFDSLHATDNGLALAAPQIGIQKQIIVWDIDDEPQALLNPEIVESDGEWVYDEGCLSIPGLVRGDAPPEPRPRRAPGRWTAPKWNWRPTS
ncbi:MAG: peptide deformylase [Ilumatobacteraceae bacterium]